MSATSPSPAFVLVIEAADAIERGDHAAAQTLLDDLVNGPVPADPVERVAHLFGHALSARMHGDQSGTGNLYQRADGPANMLAAFQMLAEATPVIRFGHECANSALIHALPAGEAIVLIDIGIGSGVQWHGLLDRFASLEGRWRTLRLIGIDVPGRAGDALERLQGIGRSLAGRAARAGVAFAFAPVVGLVEELDLEALVKPATGERLAVNAALALHHVPDSAGMEARDQVISALAALQPAVVTLVEPDVEHNALPFRARVVEALLHYVTVFDALGASLPDHPAERLTLEQAFFGREILNVVTGEGIDRVERHERFDRWAARFRRHGFLPIDLQPLGAQIQRAVRVEPPWMMIDDAKALVLTWRDQRMLAASAWRPASSSG